LGRKQKVKLTRDGEVVQKVEFEESETVFKLFMQPGFFYGEAPNGGDKKQHVATYR
jgi:hypothetical protein